jgi:hypothetical protein
MPGFGFINWLLRPSRYVVSYPKLNCRVGEKLTGNRDGPQDCDWLARRQPWHKNCPTSQLSFIHHFTFRAFKIKMNEYLTLLINKLLL